MAVRLCDVASLLRSGSWAPEPWTGVCGTSILNSLGQRPAVCLSAQAIPMKLALTHFEWPTKCTVQLAVKRVRKAVNVTVLVWSNPVHVRCQWCDDARSDC